GLAFNSVGNLAVSNYSNNTVSLFSSAGVFQSSISTNLNGPTGMAFSSAPEPGTLAFLALGGTLVLVRRRGRKQEA
uniref:PEP-CTERM sorting domain-containing protein n=1 Tax=Armatimonas sp. TaxID=1872638 RepID=UPI00286A8D9F